jgi:hypothetical protein
MGHLRGYARLAPAAVAFALVVACGNGPSSHIAIVGPVSIAPGQSANYSVSSYGSDGVGRTVPATWSSSNPSLLQIDATGRATAQSASGDVVVSAEADGLRATREVLVIHPGRYRLVGLVTGPSGPVSGVRLEVAGGPTATSEADGSYRLYGLSGLTDISLTRDGYHPALHRLDITAHTSHNFVLDSPPPHNLAGTYTLTVESQTECSGDPPLRPDLRRRTYTAVISQTDWRLEVRLTEPRFVNILGTILSEFTGYVTPQGATFVVMEDGYDASYRIVEQLPDGTVLNLSGSATTSGSSAGLSGPYRGEFRHWERFPFPTQNLGFCAARTFTLTPQ